MPGRRWSKSSIIGPSDEIRAASLFHFRSANKKSKEALRPLLLGLLSYRGDGRKINKTATDCSGSSFKPSSSFSGRQQQTCR
jgi:hypothetical protein